MWAIWNTSHVTERKTDYQNICDSIYLCLGIREREAFLQCTFHGKFRIILYSFTDRDERIRMTLSASKMISSMSSANPESFRRVWESRVWSGTLPWPHALSCRVAVVDQQVRVYVSNVFGNERTNRRESIESERGEREWRTTRVSEEVSVCRDMRTPHSSFQMSSMRRCTGFPCRDERRSSSGLASCSGTDAMMPDDASSWSASWSESSVLVWTGAVASTRGSSCSFVQCRCFIWFSWRRHVDCRLEQTKGENRNDRWGHQQSIWLSSDHV